MWTLAGGPVFGLLALLGCVAVCLFANRLLNLRRAQIDYVDFMRGVSNVLARGNADEALVLCDELELRLSSFETGALSGIRK